MLMFQHFFILISWSVTGQGVLQIFINNAQQIQDFVVLNMVLLKNLKATWMSDTPYTYSDIDEQDDLDSLLCNIMRSKDTNIPRFAGYEKASGSRS
jgi:hypothetical protein